jgi:hypothetical protein
MATDHEPVPLRRDFLSVFDLHVLELDDRAAAQTHHVVMVLVPEDVLVACFCRNALTVPGLVYACWRRAQPMPLRMKNSFS